jgi:hypothetical protein
MNGVQTLAMIIRFGTPFDLSKRAILGKSSLRPFDFDTDHPVAPYRSKVTTAFPHVALSSAQRTIIVRMQHATN